MNELKSAAICSWFLAGCAAPIQDVRQSTGAVGTVVNVSWWSPEDGEGWAAFKSSGRVHAIPASRTQADGGYRYEATLLGLTSDATASVSLQVRADNRTAEEIVEVHAGRLEMVLPSVTTTVTTVPLDGYLLTSFLYEPSAAVILNHSGQPVWAVAGREGAVISETRLHPDGGQIIYSEYGLGDGDSESEQSQIVRVDLKTGEQDRQHAPGLHHDFVVLGDGTVAYLRHDKRVIDGASVLGDSIVELSENGTSEQIWSAWPTIEYTTETPADATGWTHANALVYDADEDAYYVSLYNYNAILKISRQTGEILWTLGGPHSDFSVPEADTHQHQHNFHLLGPDHILLFDNGPYSVRETEVLELLLDEGAGAAEVVWRYQPADPVNTMVFGDVERLSSGNTLATFSGSGRIDEITPDGEVQWQMESPFGAAFGYSKWIAEPQAFFEPH